MNKLTLLIILITLLSGCNRNTSSEVITLKIDITSNKPDTISLKTDSLIIIIQPTVINQDSLDRVDLIKDSIAFRKAVKRINGGYNGFNERYKIWLRARKELHN